MSMFIVDREHIDLLVTAALAFELEVPEEATELGRALWRENLRSAKYRYPNDTDGQRPGPCDFRDGDVDTYEFTLIEGRVDPAVVIAAASGYLYQSCEHPSFDVSHACVLARDLGSAAEGHLERYAQRHGHLSASAARDLAYCVTSREVFLEAEKARAESLARRPELAGRH